MDAATFFLLRYEPLHGAVTERLFADLTDSQLRQRPAGQNSIAWLLWHVARGEDMGVNRVAYDGRQVFDDDDWQQRLRTGTRNVGTAMTSDEVAALSARVDLRALRDYWDAVGNRTRQVIRTHSAEGWDEPVDVRRLQRLVREEGDFGSQAGFVEEFYVGAKVTPGWAFAHMALTHTWGHFFEAGVVRGMLGFPGR